VAVEVALVLVLGALPVATLPPAAADIVDTGSGGRPDRVGALLSPDDPSATVLPELNGIPVHGVAVAPAEAAVRHVLEQLELVAADHEAARALEARLGEELLALGRARTGHEAQLADTVAARDRAAAQARTAGERVDAHQREAEAARLVLEEVALTAYLGAGGADLAGVQGRSPAGDRIRYLDEVWRGQSARRSAALDAAAGAAADQQAATDEATGHEQRRAELEAQLVEADRAGAALDTRLIAARQAQVDADAAGRRLDDALVAARAELAAARRTATVTGGDFPLVLLDAFVRAERFEAEHRPACRLGWPLLAAISRVESRHGTAGGSTVDAAGNTAVILGPPLTPGGGFAVIADTDGGVLDGDPLYDRAVGPMQFIPSSWRLYALDGNADGHLDPRNYYDAALAAAEHLCRTGADTSTEAGRRVAVLGYNRSESYLAMVVALTDSYAALSW
jgi:membrane-bound lytic murein transglycosylase B